MVILGPGTITHGLNPATALMGSGDVAYLGPSVGPSTEVDPISRLFVLLGKLISVRRVASPVEPGVVDFSSHPEHPLGQFGAVTEAVLGFESGGEFDVVWRPLVNQVRRDAVASLGHLTTDIDHRTRRFIAAETHAVLALDPTASVEERMESVDAYLRQRGYTVEQTSGGFRDFIARSFTDSQGHPIHLPTSTNPSFPDSWITSDQINAADHGGTRRGWHIIF